MSEKIFKFEKYILYKYQTKKIRNNWKIRGSKISIIFSIKN